MPYAICPKCLIRFYDRPDGTRPHSCKVKKHGNSGPRKERTLVPCAWPDCANTVPALLVAPDKWREYTQYRIDDFGGAGLVRYPICHFHRDRIRSVLGPLARMNGIKAILRTDNETLAGRAINAPMTRLVIYEKAGRKCQHCNTAMDFNSRWHADHIIPLFKGGTSSLANLQALCQPCHHIKSAPEKREANGLRYKVPGSKRWMTHRHKDQLIADLQRQVADLNSRLGKS